MEDIYYVDRPSIPAERQNIIHIDAILEHAILLDSVDINPTLVAHAVEVRNSFGDIEGTLVYFSNVTHAQLTTLPTTETETDEINETGIDPDVWGDLSYTAQTTQTVDEFNNESRLIDLELDLAEAIHTVQKIENQIAEVEKELSID